MFPITARHSYTIILLKYLILPESSFSQVDTYSYSSFFISKVICLQKYLENYYAKSIWGNFQNEFTFRLSLVQSYNKPFLGSAKKSLASNSEGLDENL